MVDVQLDRVPDIERLGNVKVILAIAMAISNFYICSATSESTYQHQLFSHTRELDEQSRWKSLE
ncbi:hypothetical protein [Synechococcus sp. PCC 7336]|uniref:hypothetical protein n=1 Tax=Synechococcus sp. PCC 7336 TaxID=195250 RepID=UPI0012EA02CF|nr:hypothetical protein [Synechococcus sp. PCC 7336]